MRCAPMVWLLLSCSGLFASARAQEVSATPSGDFLVRFRHFEGRDFAPGGDHNFVRQRARLGLRLAYGEEISTFVQLQDTRTWGEETDTLGDVSADGLDLHQGYLELALDPALRLRIGRQEFSYLNHRLIGSWPLAEQPRSFDAIRLSGEAFEKCLTYDAFYARLLDALPEASLAADDLFAWMVRAQLGAYFQPALIGVVDLSSGSDRIRVTNGVLIESQLPIGLRFSIEGYLQTGSATVDGTDVDYFAWMFGSRLRFTLVDLGAKPFVEVLVEMLSGDDDPTDGDEGTFDTLYATNVRYYGEANFFLNTARDTAKRGLLDAAATLGMGLGEGGFAQVTLHLFATVENQGGPSDYGQEVDVTAGAKLHPHLWLDANYSLFLPGAAFAAEGDAEHFFFVRAISSF